MIQEDTSTTMEQTRLRAVQALERATDAARDLRHSVQGLADRGIGAVSESAAAAQRQFGQYAQNSTRYVAEHPLKSALIAAAVGAAVAGIVIAVRHQQRDKAL